MAFYIMKDIFGGEMLSLYSTDRRWESLSRSYVSVRLNGDFLRSQGKGSSTRNLLYNKSSR